MHDIARAEVVGSLVRPAFLMRARQKLNAAAISIVDYKQVEDRAVDAVVAQQEGLGLHKITDGEMRRLLFMAPLTEAVAGIVPVEGFTHQWRGPRGDVAIPSPSAVTEKIRRKRSLLTEEYAYARSQARAPLKVTVPSPMLMLFAYSEEHSRGAYPDPMDLVADSAEILRAEIEELAGLGCTEIQIDAPELTGFADPTGGTIQAFKPTGLSSERLLAEGIDILSSLTNVPGVRFAIHLCRGNHSGHWLNEGGYDEIAEVLFRRAVGFDTFLLEYDSARAGGFEPLAHAPEDKVLVLGLVSSKDPALEDRASVTARIRAAASFFPLAQLALSSQCGFGTGANDTIMSESRQLAKLELVVDSAEEVWG